MAAWDFNIEFSGITIVHLSGGVDGKKTGKAYLSKGISGRHKPWLLVPMEGLLEPLGNGILREWYGLTTIPIPGGGYLLQVGLEDCTVDFDSGLTAGGTVAYVNNHASEDGTKLDWSDISYAMDIARLARTGGHSENFSATCSGSVTLPGGRLTSVPPSVADHAQRMYSVCWVGQTKQELWKQRATDRLRLTVQCDQPTTNIKLKKKGGPDLVLKFGPRNGSPGPTAITFSSNCAAGTGSADEVKEFGALLNPPSGFNARVDPPPPSGPQKRFTDDHPCFSGFWID